MAIFTKAEFRAIANERAGVRTFSRVLNEARSESSVGKTTSVFLSHCHTDADLVGQVIAFLKGFDISVYVDWLDNTMPTSTNGQTARKVKDMISVNDKFIFLATNQSLISRWCNWELGIGDVYKHWQDKIAILPLSDTPGDWLGNEYLQIYPRVEPVKEFDTIFKLIYPDNSSVWFDDWLKSKTYL